MFPQSSKIRPEDFIEHLPGLIFFKNNELNYIACNDRFNKLSGFTKKNSLLGYDDYHLSWSNYADAYRDADRRVMKEKRSLAFLEPLRLSDGKELLVLSRKFPFYDQSETIIGITCSITVVTSPDIVREISLLSKTDFELLALSQYQPKNYIVADHFEHFNLSKCETTCLFYLVRGKTAKEIAVIVSKSKRTIEKHIDNIRYKLNCKTKSEVVSKAIEHGFVHFIPSDFLINQTN